MRKLTSLFLAALMTGAVGNLPARCSTEKPVGSVTQARDASLDWAAAVVGTTVYPGDSVQTAPDGLIRLASGASQLYLMSSSSSVLLDSSNGIRAELSHGTAGFVSDSTHSIELIALGAAIRSQVGTVAHGRVSIVGASELAVTSVSGPFDISIDGDIHTIADGKSYRVEIVDADQSGNGSGTVSAIRTHRKLLKVVLISAAVVATGVGVYFIYHELNESPSKPNNQ